MRMRLCLFVVLAGAMLSVSVACGEDDDVAVNPTPSVLPEQLVGRPMPDATGENLTGSGSASLSSLKGSPAVVAFWLNACTDCQKVMPELQALAGKLSNVKFASVAIDDKDANGTGSKGYETPKAFAATAKLTMPSIVVPRATADKAFNLYRIPTVFLVDSSGVVAKTFVWPFTTAEVETAAMALK